MNEPWGPEIIRTPLGVFVLRDDTVLSRWIERDGRLDIPLNLADIATFAHCLPYGGVAIDAGACLGDHTLTYSQLVGAPGHVYAFEPHPVTYQALLLNMARLNNVRVFNAAISDRNDARRFQRDTNIGGSYLSPDGTDAVVCVSLDEYLVPKLWRCDFIHLDLEGGEPKALLGAVKLIRKFRPAMVIEVCDRHLRRVGSSESELLAYLDGLGYDVTPLPSQTDRTLHDVLCIPKETP